MDFEADVELGKIPVYHSGDAASLKPSYCRASCVSMQLPGFPKNSNTHCRKFVPFSDFLFAQSLVFEREMYTNNLIA